MIKCEGLDVGRDYLTRLPAGDRWLWTIYMNDHVPQIAGVPISDPAITLDEAASQFKQSHEAMHTKAGLPRPQRRAPHDQQRFAAFALKITRVAPGI